MPRSAREAHNDDNNNNVITRSTPEHRQAARRKTTAPNERLRAKPYPRARLKNSSRNGFRKSRTKPKTIHGHASSRSNHNPKPRYRKNATMLGSRNAHSRDPNERYDHVIKRVLSG